MWGKECCVNDENKINSPAKNDLMKVFKKKHINFEKEIRKNKQGDEISDSLSFLCVKNIHDNFLLENVMCKVKNFFQRTSGSKFPR